MEKYNNLSERGSVRIPVCDKTVTTEISGDFTLPDYQPEIKRLLRVGAAVLPPSRYISDRQAEFAGNIDYYVIYTGSDNGVYCAPLTAEYKIDIPFELGETGDGDSYISEFCGAVSAVPDMISGRVMAPRKLNIKCRLKARGQLYGDMELGGNFADGEDDTQTLVGVNEAVKRSWIMGDMMRLSDEMICDNKDTDLRVVMADGRVFINEITPTNGAVSCRGDVYMKLMLCRDDGSAPYSVTRKMPLSQTVTFEGVTPSSSVCARGSVGEMNITVEEGRIGMDIGVLLECEACIPERISYIKDIYSTTRKTENNYKICEMPSFGVATNGNFTLSDSKSLDEAGIAVGATVVDISGIAYPDEYDLEGEKCALLGKSRFSLLIEKDGEYSTADIELPFSYRTGVAGKYDSAMFSCEIISARARVDGERIGIDAEVAVSGSAMSFKKEKLLSRVGFGDELERSRGEFVVCYPSNDDSLWSVAKRYGADIGELADNNGVNTDVAPDSSESLKDLKYLVI